MAQLATIFILFFFLFNPASAGPRFGFPRKSVSKRSKLSRRLDDNVNPFANQNTGLSGLQAQLLYSGFMDYVLQLGVGTPASNVSLIIDTFDDFIRSDCLQSNASTYDRNKSSTFITPSCNNPQWKELLQDESCYQLPQCRYNCTYDSVAGVLANDTFGFLGSTTPRNLSFGCNDVVPYNFVDTTSGYVGIGRGPFSLISQLNFSKFSYCFTNQTDSNHLSSYMFFGSSADLDSSITVNTTSIINDSSDYILNLKGISVGSKLLPILPEMLQYVENSNGTIIYTTDPVTYLPPEAYQILRDEVIAQVALPVYNQSKKNIGYDLCFYWTSDVLLNLSIITFHFDGADMTLPTSNFMANYTDGNGTSVVCLMMDIYYDGYSYLGNYQMQNFQFIYDLENGKLSFRSIQCDKLQPFKSLAAKSDLHIITLGVLLLLYLLLA